MAGEQVRAASGVALHAGGGGRAETLGDEGVEPGVLRRQAARKRGHAGAHLGRAGFKRQHEVAMLEQRGTHAAGGGEIDELGRAGIALREGGGEGEGEVGGRGRERGDERGARLGTGFGGAEQLGGGAA